MEMIFITFANQLVLLTALVLIAAVPVFNTTLVVQFCVYKGLGLVTGSTCSSHADEPPLPCRPAFRWLALCK